MLREPSCYTRGCMHYTGVIQPDGTEMTERNACKAFPEGIPDTIAYGSNKHTKVMKNQEGDYVFTKAE